jgi:pyridinium-3,5-bisthiocarboxylic acid mononucleotide nickel chelatase
MPKIAYLECPTGIAGDMCLGAIVHAGVPLEYLIEQLERLGLGGEFKLWAESVQHNGQQATKVHVDEPSDRIRLSPPSHQPAQSAHEHSHGHSPEHSPEHSHEHPHTGSHNTVHSHAHGHAHSQAHGHAHSQAHSRNLPEIEQLIRAAQLPIKAEAWSLAVFRQLAIAEGAVHGISPEQVHFHEVGAIDAIVDIVGTCLGLDWLGIEELYCSALPTGGGTIWAAHGRLPVPAPAVLKLWELRQVPIYSNGIDRELVTPTGAAIVTTLAAEFGAPPAMILQRVGLGAGSRELAIPNILRLWIGDRPQPREQASSAAQLSAVPEPLASTRHTLLEPISVLETQIDDLSPQAIGYVFEALFAVGALDVFTQAIGMKKSRLGVLLTVICHAAQVEACEAVLFRETTTLGIRRLHQRRTVLSREIQTIDTPYGAVRVKVARSPTDEKISNVQPEYEDCAKLARQHNVAWREVHRLALQTWMANNS